MDCVLPVFDVVLQTSLVLGLSKPQIEIRQSLGTYDVQNMVP